MQLWQKFAPALPDLQVKRMQRPAEVRQPSRPKQSLPQLVGGSVGAILGAWLGDKDTEGAMVGDSVMAGSETTIP